MMADVAREIQDRSDAWMRAWIEQDRTTLEEALAPDFVEIVIAPPGRAMDRGTWLDTCARYRVSSFQYRDARVQVFGSDLAIMSSVADQAATLDGGDRSGALFLCDLWRRASDGRWLISARYSTYPDPVNQAA